MRRLYGKGQRVLILEGWDEGDFGYVDEYQLHGFVQGKTGAHKKKKETDIPHPSDYWKYLVSKPGVRKKVWYMDYEIEDGSIPNSIRFIKDE